MNAHRIKEIHDMIKNHQGAVLNQGVQRSDRAVPVGAGRDSDDLSKVASNDIIGKGGESDLRK